MKIGIFTGGISVRSKNNFTDISRHPTGKHEKIYLNSYVNFYYLQANTVLHSSGYNIVDPDANDTELFSLDCGVHTGYFTLDPNTGNTNFTSDYDVDEGSGPSSVSCVLTVTDSGGLTATANLSFYISK